MAHLNIDWELAVAIPVFTIGAAVSLGLFPASLMGFDLSRVLFSSGGVQLTLARAMSIGALVAVVVNRDDGIASLTSFVGIEGWAVYVTIGLILAPPFLPVVRGTLVETPWSVLAFLAQTVGITIVSFLN